MDVMILNKADGTTYEVEIVMTVKLENYEGDYVIYKCDNKYYGAKYVKYENKTDLITDLTEEEKNALNKIFASIKGGVL